MADPRTILVIDDSSTIRRLVDSTLSRGGYQVLLADNAETGIELALDHRPDMILLDHQLPGVTGRDVCEKLIVDPSVNTIPVVISSTQRKKAFYEYGEMDNVVDMLSKPYTEELLLTTVQNAIETGVLVVESQAHGTAVPEVIDAQQDSGFSGSFEYFTVREVIDFLNNGQKQGLLEIEADQQRYSIYLTEGRVTGVHATGVHAEAVSERLPESLSGLASVIRFTMGRGGDSLDSIVDLLNSEVLDPRLLRRLLRHQAAVLVTKCFSQPLKTFRFQANAKFPPLMKRIPLDISVLALLIEGACTLTENEVPEASSAAIFSRRPIRGQNLDRAGLTARQSLVLRQIATPLTLEQLCNEATDNRSEVRRILHGLELADLVECKDEHAAAVSVLLYEPDLKSANAIQSAFDRDSRFTVTVVHDPVAAGLLARRVPPRVVVADASDPSVFHGMQQTIGQSATRWIAIGGSQTDSQLVLQRPYDPETLSAAIQQVMANSQPVANNQGEEAQTCAV